MVPQKLKGVLPNHGIGKQKDVDLQLLVPTGGEPAHISQRCGNGETTLLKEFKPAGELFHNCILPGIYLTRRSEAMHMPMSAVLESKKAKMLCLLAC